MVKLGLPVRTYSKSALTTGQPSFFRLQESTSPEAGGSRVAEGARRRRGKSPAGLFIMVADQSPLTAEQRELVARNYGLAWLIARQHWPRLPRRTQRLLGGLEDLAQIGAVGLAIAARRFDPSRGCKFSTFAVCCIRDAIQTLLPHYDQIWVPQAVRTFMRSGKGRDRDLAATKRAVADAERARCVVSLDDGSLDQRERGWDLEDTRERPVDFLELDVLRRELRALPSRQRRVIKLRFGIRCKTLALHEVGERLGITKERVRQIEAEALAALAERMECLA